VLVFSFMVRGPAWIVVVAGLAAVGCSGNSPGEATTTDPAGIIGGTHDGSTSAIFVIEAMSLGLCSGSLIAPNLIMTAHHCVSPINETAMGVQCGTTKFGATVPPSDLLVSWDDDLSDGATRNTIHAVSKVTVPTSTALCGNDIALIELTDTVPNDQAMPIEPRVDSRPATDEPFEAVGYGIQSASDANGATAGERMRIGGLSVGCVGASQCRGTGATGTEWAADAPICSGDSGGPALDGDGRVIGIASRGDEGCTIGIYTAIDSWKTLIVDAAIQAADDAGYDPPGWTTEDTPDAGTDAGEPADADPLGESCTNACAGGYLCYSMTGEPPGICVPPCAEQSDCPSDYTCSTALGACTPAVETPDASLDASTNDDEGDSPSAKDGCGCRTAGAPTNGAPLLLAGALVLALGARRRRGVAR